MPDHTQHYNLHKPTQDEFYDIAVQNENMDEIDTALYGLSEEIAGVQSQVTALETPTVIPTAPTQSGSLTYTGNFQAPTWANYDPTELILGGIPFGIGAGTYAATFTPAAGYTWEDGTRDTKTVNWSIGKAAGSLTLSATSVTLDDVEDVVEIEVTRPGNGAVTITNSGSTYIEATVIGAASDNPRIRVKNLKKSRNAQVSVTVSAAAGDCHTAPTAGKAVTVYAKTHNVAAYTWADIKTISDQGTGPNLWSVGDCKPIVLNGTVGNTTFSNFEVDAFILGFDHNRQYEGVDRIHWQIGKLDGKGIALCDSKYNGATENDPGYFRMNLTNTNTGGWEDSYMRKTILGNDGTHTPTNPLAGSLMAALPSDLRNVMKSVSKYSDNTGNASTAEANVTATSDHLFLLAEYEVFGYRYVANTGEAAKQKQYKYYEDGNATVAFRHTATGTAVWWWLRSAYAGNVHTFGYVNSNGHDSTNHAYYSGGLRPGFCT